MDKVRCVWCGREVRVRKDGRLAVHRVQGERCEGSEWKPERVPPGLWEGLMRSVEWEG